MNTRLSLSVQQMQTTVVKKIIPLGKRFFISYLVRRKPMKIGKRFQNVYKFLTEPNKKNLTVIVTFCNNR